MEKVRKKFFGTNIVYLREQAKINRTTLAKTVGLDPQSMYLWEKKGRFPKDFDTVEVIASFFGVPIGDIVYKDLTVTGEELATKNEQGNITIETAEFTELLSNISEAGQLVKSIEARLKILKHDGK